MAPRFLLLADVAEILNIKPRQAYTLVHSGELLGIQIGGKGQWRIEATELEAYIARKYAETRARVVRGTGADRRTHAPAVSAAGSATPSRSAEQAAPPAPGSGRRGDGP